MKKFMRRLGRSDYVDQNKVRVRNEQLRKLQELLRVGGHEAEPEYVQVLKQWKPDIGREELRERIKQFHDAVSERQSLDRKSR